MYTLPHNISFWESSNIKQNMVASFFNYFNPYIYISEIEREKKLLKCTVWKECCETWTVILALVEYNTWVNDFILLVFISD